ncbi:MAG TPA: nucleoside hydrolase [Mycobacteriales bacterium]|jgi:inosine-uridine nucleoside N-ribohydrolase|nr:nucleoside hydrolase [Mycobacteriales bacterium]
MRVHLDTDFGGDTDDACALAYLLGRADVELTGVTTVADRDGMRAAYVRHLLSLAGRHVPVAAGAALSMTTGRRADPEYGDWPLHRRRPGKPGAALDLLDRSIAAGATVIGIGPCTTLALYELTRPGRLRNPVLMAGWLDPPADGLPPWGPDMDFNNQWDRRAFELLLRTGPTLVTLPATLATWIREADLPRLRSAGPVGTLLAHQVAAHGARHDMADLAAAHPALPADLLNFQYDPAACAVALGWDGVTAEVTRVRLGADGALVRDPAGLPVKVVTAVDGPAFAAHWIETVEAVGRG